MLSGAKLKQDYKHLIATMVCDADKEACMLNKCEDCPGSERAREILIDGEEECLLVLVISQNCYFRLISSVFFYHQLPFHH